MQFFSAVKPKHVVGIDHEISKKISEIDAGRTVPTQGNLCFSTRPAVDVPLKGTIDFPGGRGPLDVSAGGRPGYPVFSQQEV